MSLLGLAEGVSESSSPRWRAELAAGIAEQCCHLESLIFDFIPGAGFPNILDAEFRLPDRFKPLEANSSETVRDVSVGHKTDIPTRSPDVRFWG